MSTPQITTLITEDNVERIRDQVAAILLLELGNQYTLASTAGRSDAADYNVAVYLEKQFAFDVSGGSESFPAVNVQLIECNRVSGGASNITRRQAVFNLDCYACGNGEADSDKAATLKAWKVARLVRNVIESAQYTYLGMRTGSQHDGVICRKIKSVNTGVPSGISSSGHQVVVCRVVLEVDFEEKSPQVSGVECELWSLICKRKDGTVYFSI